MMWKISLDEQRRVTGFFPEDYQGKLPDVSLIEVDDAEKERVFAMLPAYYDESDKVFKRYVPPPPTLDELKAQKKAEIAAARYDRETAGVEVNGILVDTGRDSQALITGAALAAVIDSSYSLNWKTESGFIHLSAPEIIAVAQAVRVHVQTCFDKEGELVTRINAATTKEELDAITW